MFSSAWFRTSQKWLTFHFFWDFFRDLSIILHVAIAHFIARAFHCENHRITTSVLCVCRHVLLWTMLLKASLSWSPVIWGSQQFSRALMVDGLGCACIHLVQWSPIWCTHRWQVWGSGPHSTPRQLITLLTVLSDVTPETSASYCWSGAWQSFPNPFTFNLSVGL